MQIGNKEVKEIVIKDNTGELIADITDDDIISKTNIIVELISPTKEEHMETAKPRNEWRRFELITEDEKMIAALDSLLDRKQLSREELAIILLSLRVRPGIGGEAFGTELQNTRDSLIGAQ